MATRASSLLADTNAVYGLIGEARANSSVVWYVGQFESADGCRAAVVAADAPVEARARKGGGAFYRVLLDGNSSQW